MKTVPSHRLSRLCTGLALFGAFGAADAAVGARVLLQEWSPLTPKQQSVRVLASDPSVVSDAIQKAWSEARPKICDQLQAAMGKGGAAAGQTLYDIKCLLDEAATFSVASAGANALAASLAVSGYVEATSTTPLAAGKYADPRFSLALTARVLLTMSVQPSLDQTLRIDKAQFKLSDATLDSQGMVGDLLKFVSDDLIPYFHGPNYRHVAENAIDSVAVELAGRFNAALVPVNVRLRGPSGAVRVAVWGKPDAIVVAFGPRELSPPSGGMMFGALRWDTSKILAPGRCDSFSIDAAVQTGPAPLRDPGGYYEAGDAPMRKVGSFQLEPDGATGECHYRVSGLAAAWPNELSPRSSLASNARGGTSSHTFSYALAGDGWDGRNVIPQPNAERNYVIRATLSGSASLDPAAAIKKRLASPDDPRINPVDRMSTGVLTPDSQRAALPAQGRSAAPATPGTRTTANGTPSSATLALQPARSSFGPQQGGAASLNPQPLPPDPPDPKAPVLRWSPTSPAVLR